MPLLSEIEAAFSDHGFIARALADAGEPFESRSEQLAFASAVQRCMAVDESVRVPLMVEAGTGVGKSLAYLLPAALRIVNKGERVVIATHTIALQEQLLDKDVPVIRRALALAGLGDIRVALVKGRGNYISVRRLDLALSREDRLFVDVPSRRSLHAIRDWAAETADGSLATLPQLERPGVWERVESDSGNCMGRKCPTYDRCFYQRARREMEQADLLICNHALFFSDLALRTSNVGFLPRYHHVVLDEAHMVEDVAAECFGASLSEGRIRRLLGALRHRSGRGFLSTLRVEEAERGSVEHAARQVAACEEAASRTFEDLARDAQRRENEAASGAARIPSARADEHALVATFTDLSLRLKRLREHAVREDDKFELNAYAERAGAIASDAAALLAQTIPDAVYWLESARRVDGAARVTLACSPVDVAPILRERLFNGEVSVTLCSATLATGSGAGPGAASYQRPAPGERRFVPEGEESAPPPARAPARRATDPFAHAKRRLGCDDADTLLLGSPFDHARLVMFHVEHSMPDPRAPGYTQRLAEAVLRHVVETDGGAFVLFTSFESLRAVARLLRDDLERRGIPVLVQEGGAPGAGMSRAALLAAFRADERSVLFGTASFWQGVDVRGRGLRNVIITRLPFEPPDRPLTQARIERIEASGGDAFMEETLPRAALRFKQGFGRLVRGKEDHGRVVVLDPRILTKGYGRVFLDALPPGVRPRQGSGGEPHAER